MKTYRKNAIMAGVLYFLGTVFGVLSTVVGGEVISSIARAKPLSAVNLLVTVAATTGGCYGILVNHKRL